MQELCTLFWLSAFYNFQVTAVYSEAAKNTLAKAISCMHEPKHLGHFAIHSL